MSAYFVAIDNRPHGPLGIEQLASMGVRPDQLVWAEGMPDWRRADSVPGLRHLFERGSSAAAAPPPPPGPRVEYHTPSAHYVASAANSRIAAGVCGIVLGALGVHKFVLGFTGAGLTMLLVTVLTCGVGGWVMGTIGLIEGIIYLTRSDAEFYRLYVVERKQWF